MNSLKLFRITRENISCQVYLSVDVYKALFRLIKPFFKIEKISEENSDTWTIIESVNPYEISKGFSRSIEKNGEEPPIDLYINLHNKVIGLNNASLRWKPIFILRLLRNIFRWEFYKQGAVFIHGGLVEYMNYGIAIIGHKKTGKTSTILSLLAKEGINFSTNDDLLVACNDEELKAFGWPRSIGVRKETLMSLKDFAPNYIDSILKLKHPGLDIYKTNNEITNLPNIVDFLPSELANCYSKKIFSKLNLKFLVFPKFTNDLKPSVTILSPKDAYGTLMESLEVMPSSYNLFLKDYYGLNDSSLIPKIKEMIDSTVSIQLNQSMENLEEASNLLLNLFEEITKKGRVANYE
ncbi:hypothetical protein FHE72_01195 [Rossellomorea vietnamensis]|uniref:HprK n=1 Tax=Rossellomorea vietnamensis TaxID=218284 RepID=A0A6I6UJY1_9BACI|nr:hypothetical protein [Rossellomorea vietnamensis]QHE59809.1 hypothetical protein FHE72_01195 [Rossellomorea vietnamensis]